MHLEHYNSQATRLCSPARDYIIILETIIIIQKATAEVIEPTDALKLAGSRQTAAIIDR